MAAKYPAKKAATKKAGKSMPPWVEKAAAKKAADKKKGNKK